MSFATHFALSNLGVAGDVETNEFRVPVGLEEDDVDFGVPKKEVMLVSVLGFLGSAGDEERLLSALRFWGPPIGDGIATVDWRVTRPVGERMG